VVGPPAIGARTIGPSGKILRVGELDGTWNVYRTGGLLPPLYGVHKRIAGGSGSTRIGPLVGVPFDVVGLELRYRAPFAGFVDVLTPREDGSYSGRATFRGRTFGSFRLTRSLQS
jgi:hypothetical protein